MEKQSLYQRGDVILKLPEPRFGGKVSVEEALLNRRSVREYSKDKLTMQEISQILWASQGITQKKWRLRTVPSAGALYPIEVYAVLEEGVFHYRPYEHSLKLIKRGDVRCELCEACLNQEYVRNAPLVLVFTGVFNRTCSKYGERGVRYVLIEVGHASQNVYLQCESLGLGTVAIGAFYDLRVKKILDLPREHEPLYVMPVGRKK